MPKSIKEILSGSVLNEDIKTELQKAYDARILEQREEINTELREEFAARYTNDKKQVVEAMDALLKDALKTELTEFAIDRANTVKEKMRYKKSISEHAKMLNKFINETLVKEITELRSDRKAQKTNFGKLEEFVLKQLTNELNEFHSDKQDLANQKVKMVREGKKIIEETKKNFIKKAAKHTAKLTESLLRKEITTLRNDIQTAKENDFGRKIFEAYTSEFVTSTLNENTQVSKLAKQIVDLKQTVAESKTALKAKDQKLNEAKHATKMAQDRQVRKAMLGEMLAPLNKNQKELMGTLLESVQTQQLKTSYKKYLPSVLNENKKPAKRQRKLTESSKTITGNKVTKSTQSDSGNSAKIFELKKLAGLS